MHAKETIKAETKLECKLFFLFFFNLSEHKPQLLIYII